MTPTTDAAHAMRHAMVASQLRTNSVNDARVLEAMSTEPRERYLPEQHREIAYRDTLLPLTGGRRHNSPLVIGRLLTEAQVAPNDAVLVIGAAGGYSAAILADLACSVTALESDPELASLAREALAGKAGVTVVEGPLNQGWAANAPYDLIVVDGAVEEMPEGVMAQLKDGGRVATGIVDRGVTRLATGRKSGSHFSLVPFADIEVAVLPGFEKAKTFQF
ncbi:protein-L-isoaspartate O-methyltransferase [Nostoc sp. 3335mG]|nr:protein-L-isoaspartate O-methyltransferase [Nostoc sp. 3335mG]